MICNIIYLSDQSYKILSAIISLKNLSNLIVVEK